MPLTFDDVLAGLADFESLTEKLAFPSRRMVWLGYEFDYVKMEVSIPRDKLEEISAEAAAWDHRHRATKHQLQVLAGRLQFISNCVRPARRFMARIIKTLRPAHQVAAVDITEEFRKDIRWFPSYARATNARVLVEPKLSLIVIECDACLVGAGGHSANQFYDLTFPQKVTDTYHISQLEVLNILIAIKTLVPKDAHGIRFLVRTDNMAAMYILSSGRSKDGVLAACSREIWLIEALQDIDILVNHTPGESLVLADALSRRTIDFSRSSTNPCVAKTPEPS